MAESTQHKLDRVRPPRVQITYDVEVGGAIQMKELPLVVGVLADLVGQQEKVPRLKERKFVQIDRDNFNDVMKSLNPKLRVTVPNRLTGEGKLTADLNFSEIDDFHPTAVIKQVEVLRKLLETRQRLVDLLAKLDGNEDLHTVLQKMLGNNQSLQDVRKQLAAPKK
jgi:type VI secretion system protein ImpB